MIHCVLPLTSGKLTVAGMDVAENGREIKKDSSNSAHARRTPSKNGKRA